MVVRILPLYNSFCSLNVTIFHLDHSQIWYTHRYRVAIKIIFSRRFHEPVVLTSHA